MQSNPVALDFETIYDESYSIQGSTYWHYVNDPRFHAYQVSMVGDDFSYVGSVESAPWDRLVGRSLIAHNAAFDKAVLERLIELNKVPNMRTPSFHCTLDLCAYHQMPRGLANAAKEVLGVTVSKVVRSQMKGRTWESLSASEREALSAYALKDSELCRDLWMKLGSSWPMQERFLSDHTRDAGMRGLHIDVTKLTGSIDLLRTAVFHLGKMLPWFTSGDIKPLSLIHIREQGRKDNIEVPGSLDLRDPDAIAWETKYAPLFDWVRALRGYRRVNALLKKLETLLMMCRPDGTAPYQLKYFGAAATGRWSGNGGWNLQNIPRNPIVVCKKCWGCNFDDGTLEENANEDTICPFCKSDDVEFIDMRGLIMAPPGKVFVVSDYAQIEARMLLWQVKDFVTLEQVSKGESVYSAHARVTMNWNGVDLKKEDKRLYALAKARCLSADTLVLTNTGYKAIVSIKGTDTVWDGHEWVGHSGVKQTGTSVVAPVSGDHYTKEHELYVSERETVKAGNVPEGESPAYLFRRSVAIPGWNEVWFLACAVAKVYSGLWILKASMRLRDLWDRARGVKGQPS